jgi:predicted GIY-YIG superfamily endonuclease
MDNWWVYMVEKGKILYVGITIDLANRMRQHGNPKLLFKEGPLAKTEAVLRERQIKGWSRDKKLKLLDGCR